MPPANGDPSPEDTPISDEPAENEESKLRQSAFAEKPDPDQTDASAPGIKITDEFLNESIDKHRKGDFTITIEGYEGQVSYELVRHKFEFGTAISARMFRDPDPKEGPTAEDQANYQEILTKYFNAVVVENAHKWALMENAEGPRPDRVTEAVALEQWARDHDLFMRGHCIFWGVAHWMPDWNKELAKQEPEIIEQRMKARLKHVLNLFDDKITEWDLNNEMMHEDIFGDAMGWDNGSEYFKWAKEAAPDVTFYVNEYGVLQGNEVDRYVDHIRQLLDAGAEVGGIGDQAHFFKPLPPSEQQWAILDKLGQFGLPVKITEFDLGYKKMDREDQAADVRRFYRICFAHPAVEGIYMWGFWAGRHWRKNAALWARDWTPHPAAEAYIQLMEQDFTTRGETEVTNENGLSFRGFEGTYRITVGNKQHEVTLTQEQPTATIDPA